MNCLSQEKDTLSDFRNLLQSRNSQEARLLLVCKQEALQSLSETFALSVNLMQQLLEDVFCNVFSSRSRTTMSIKWGCNLSFWSCTIWRLHFLHFATIFSLIVTRRLGISFNFAPCHSVRLPLWLQNNLAAQEVWLG